MCVIMQKRDFINRQFFLFEEMKVMLCDAINHEMHTRDTKIALG